MEAFDKSQESYSEHLYGEELVGVEPDDLKNSWYPTLSAFAQGLPDNHDIQVKFLHRDNTSSEWVHVDVEDDPENPGKRRIVTVAKVAGTIGIAAAVTAFGIAAFRHGTFGSKSRNH